MLVVAFILCQAARCSSLLIALAISEQLLRLYLGEPGTPLLACPFDDAGAGA